MAFNCSSETECGLHSGCSSGICVCDEGFFRGGDFTGLQNTPDCSFHTNTVVALHALSFCVEVISFICYASVMRRWSQVRRLIPFYITVISSAAYAVLKVSNVEERFVGSDPALTVFFSLTLAMLVPTLHVSVSKYIYTQMKLLQFEPTHAKAGLKIAGHVLNVFTFASIAASLLVMIFTAPYFSDSQRETMLRAALGVYGIGVIVNAGALVEMNARIIKDIKEKALEIDQSLAKVIRTLEGVKNSSRWILLLCGLFLFSGCIDERVLELWVYFTPIVFSFLAFGTIVVLLFNKGKLGRSKTKTPITLKKTNAFTSVEVGSGSLPTLKP